MNHLERLRGVTWPAAAGPLSRANAFLGRSSHQDWSDTPVGRCCRTLCYAGLAPLCRPLHPWPPQDGQRLQQQGHRAQAEMGRKRKLGADQREMSYLQGKVAL